MHNKWRAGHARSDAEQSLKCPPDLLQDQAAVATAGEICLLQWLGPACRRWKPVRCACVVGSPQAGRWRWNTRDNQAPVQRLPVLAFPPMAPDGCAVGDRAAAEECPAAEKGPVQVQAADEPGIWRQIWYCWRKVQSKSGLSHLTGRWPPMMGTAAAQARRQGWRTGEMRRSWPARGAKGRMAERRKGRGMAAAE